MARLSSEVDRRTIQPLSETNLEALVAHVHAGTHPRELAKRLHPSDAQARRVLYRRLERAILTDQRFAQRLHDRSAVELAVGLGPTIRALVGRATQRRDPVAIKLLLEITGYHNPKIKHEHSGEIKIKIDMPRPTFDPDGVTDAVVVDD